MIEQQTRVAGSGEMCACGSISQVGTSNHLKLSISERFGRTSRKERKSPGTIHRLHRTTEFGVAVSSCFPTVLRCLAPENPISKCGIREHYRGDAGRPDHHQSLAGGR